MSLRDIQRLLDVANWFFRQRRDLFPAIDGMGDNVIQLDDEEEAEVYGQVRCFPSQEHLFMFSIARFHST